MAGLERITTLMEGLSTVIMLFYVAFVFPFLLKSEMRNWSHAVASDFVLCDFEAFGNEESLIYSRNLKISIIPLW